MKVFFFVKTVALYHIKKILRIIVIMQTYDFVEEKKKPLFRRLFLASVQTQLAANRRKKTRLKKVFFLQKKVKNIPFLRRRQQQESVLRLPSLSLRFFSVFVLTRVDFDDHVTAGEGERIVSREISHFPLVQQPSDRSV